MEEQKHYCKTCNTELEVIVYQHWLDCYDGYLYCDPCDKQIGLEEKEEYYSLNQ